MKIERDTVTTTYKNDFCVLNVPKDNFWTPRLITFIGKYDLVTVEISRREASRLLKKMKKIS